MRTPLIVMTKLMTTRTFIIIMMGAIVEENVTAKMGTVRGA